MLAREANYTRQTDSQAEIEAREADYTRQAGRNISKRNRLIKGQAEM